MPRSYATSPKRPKKTPPKPDGRIIYTEDAIESIQPVPVVPGKTYADGVADVCKRVAQDARLAVKMTSGETLGATIAQQIKRDLLP